MLIRTTFVQLVIQNPTPVRVRTDARPPQVAFWGSDATAATAAAVR